MTRVIISGDHSMFARQFESRAGMGADRQQAAQINNQNICILVVPHMATTPQDKVPPSSEEGR